MTKRKPPGMSMETWVESQIRHATAQGELDNLPGAGKPLANLDADTTEQWLTGFLRREGLSADPLLPEPLRLRKEIERLPDLVRPLRSEDQVRAVVEELNDRVRAWMRSGTEPFHVPLVAEEAIVDGWRATRPEPEPELPAPVTPRRRWWRRGR
ncbi:DnaJ family domain-containing protein [Actinokineospora iranica]|uniref:DnaJ homologue subfamily C member 28 conserved domain-containing protein n=1 Tax=Actinokineospora iranica TaxID=1271860 RepID=A0A1G6S1I7_9PSEU|nr:DUF1992 domain-containing protein [Actinokineospora iranica]SDD10036.1 protein of unknown function [Actinokineospora iranica]